MKVLHRIILVALTSLAVSVAPAQGGQNEAAPKALWRDKNGALKQGKPFAPETKFLGWKYRSQNRQSYLGHFTGKRNARHDFSNVFNAKLPRSGATTSLSAVIAGQFAFRPKLPTGAIPTALVTGDFDGDKNTDCIVANGADSTLWFYRGRGDGTWDPPRIINIQEAIAPISLATADLRGLGILDLIIGSADNHSIAVMLGNGDGTFQAPSYYTIPGIPVSIAAVDVNKDGIPDVVVGLAYGEADTLSNAPLFLTFPGDGNGNLEPPLPGGAELNLFGVNWIVVGQLKQNGYPDVVAATSAGAVFEFSNNGDFTFHLAGSVPYNSFAGLPPSAAIGDVNHDGCGDVVETSGFAWAFVLLGNCDGTFQAWRTFGLGDLGVGIVLADINNDGNLDIVTSGVRASSDFGSLPGDMVSVLLGDGSGNFGNARIYRAEPGMFALAAADVNGDGKIDILAVGEDSDALSILINDGHGGFGNPQGEYFADGRGSLNDPYFTFQIADVNGDGKQDLLVPDVGQYGDASGTVLVLLNQGDGTFSDPMRVAVNPGPANGDYFFGGLSFVAGDFRNTGHADLASFYSFGFDTGDPATLSFAPGNGDGSFGPYSSTPLAFSPIGPMLAGDFNGDGRLDIATLGYSTSQFTVQIMLGNGDGTFKSSTVAGSVPPFIQPFPQILCGDFNGDGKLDILVTIGAGNSAFTNDLYELLGNGDGTFQAAKKVLSSIGQISVIDVNHDGRPDVLEGNTFVGVPAKSTTPYLHVNLARPDGSFVLKASYSPYTLASVTDGGSDFPFVVGDFNGDGNIDFAVMEQYSGLVSQILLGKGDGTFTPTYNINDFQDPDGSTGILVTAPINAPFWSLVRLDPGAQSIHTVDSSPAPAVHLQFLERPMIKANGAMQVALNAPAAVDTTVALSTTMAGINIPSSVIIPAGTLVQTVSFTVDTSFDKSQVFSVTAQLGGSIVTDYDYFGNQTLIYGFELSAAPALLMYEVQVGQTQIYNVFVNSIEGYTSDVTLSCANLPAGTNCQFLRNPVHLGTTGSVIAQLYVSTSGATPGIYTIHIIADDGFSHASTTATLYIDGAIFVSTPLLINGTITTPPHIDFGAVPVGSSKTAAFTISALSAVTNLSFGSNSADFVVASACPISLAQSKSCTVNVTFRPTSSGSRLGKFQIFYGGLNGSEDWELDGFGSTTDVVLYPPVLNLPTIQVNDLSDPAYAMTLFNNSNTPLNIIKATSSDSHFMPDVSFCSSGAAAHSSCTIAVHFHPGSAGQFTTTYTLYFSGPPGSPVTSTVNGAGATYDFDMSVADPNLSILPQQLATYSGTITAKDAPLGLFSVSCQGDVPWLCQTELGVVSTGAHFTETVTAVNANDYQFQVMGLSASYQHVVPVTLHVADMQLSGPPPIKVFPGTDTSQTLLLTPLNGFSFPVALSCFAPTGSTCQISPTSVTPAGSAIPISVNATAPSTVGPATIRNFASAVGYGGSITKEQSLVLDVVDFALTQPAAITVAAGNPVPFTVTTSSLGDFTGTVDLSCTGAPSGSTCQLSKNSVSLLAGQSINVRGLLTVASNTPTGSYNLTLSAATAGAPAAKTQNLTLNVVSGSASGDASLAISHLPSNSPAQVGSVATFNLDVMAGSNIAASGQVVIFLSQTVQAVNLPSGCSQSDTVEIVCSFSSISLPSTFHVSLQMPFIHDLSVQAILTSDVSDTNPTNNIAADEIAVRPRPFTRAH